MFRATKGFTLIELLVVIAVLGVLAGLLMPALMSARRQARLTSCASNLNQIGQAAHMYLNRYNDYFPAYPGYGRNVGRMEEMKEGVLYAATNDDFRTLASRYMVMALNTGREPSDLQPGRLNFMPVGLGNLVVTDMLPDVRALMCPSMAGDVRTFYGADDDFDFHADLDRRIGGLEPSRLMYGDGRQLRSQTNNAVAMLSSYSYRLQAHYWSPAGPNASRTLDYTNPPHNAYYMTSTFRTIRSLGERAFVSDSFDRAPGMDRGLGHYAHGNAYNVLYADGRVSTYNDPQQSIINMEPGPNQTNNLTISSPAGDRIFHIFDQAEGYDR